MDKVKFSLDQISFKAVHKSSPLLNFCLFNLRQSHLCSFQFNYLYFFNYKLRFQYQINQLSYRLTYQSTYRLTNIKVLFPSVSNQNKSRILNRTRKDNRQLPQNNHQLPLRVKKKKRPLNLKPKVVTEMIELPRTDHQLL